MPETGPELFIQLQTLETLSPCLLTLELFVLSLFLSVPALLLLFALVLAWSWSSSVLHGLDLESEHCVFENRSGTVTLLPLNTAQCSVNGLSIREPTLLTQGKTWFRPGLTLVQTWFRPGLTLVLLFPGAVILLGRTNMFRFNHPKEAARLREKRKVRPTCTKTVSRPGLNPGLLRTGPKLKPGPGLVFIQKLV